MILTTFPLELIAGDSYQISLPFTDYPTSDGWTATLYLQGATVTNFTALPTGSLSYEFDLSTTRTAQLSSGTYAYNIALTLGTVKNTVVSGYVTVQPNFATSSPDIVHCAKMLQVIQDVLEGRFTDDVQQASIAGRSLVNIPVSELLSYRVMYARELAVLRGGKPVGRVSVPIVFQPL